MQKPIQNMYEEHGSVLLMLRVMEKISLGLENGVLVERQNLARIVDFLKTFADKCHHGKEEDILFPEIAKDPARIGAINELLGEHKTGRDFIRGISGSIENYGPGNPDAYHIAVNFRSYARLLAGHIKKENLLFAAADKEFSPELQDRIARRFEELETEIIGPGKHEEYHKLLDNLRTIYLP